ncbi:alpha/beta fold hydrolase [Streptomyces sp. NPDC048718]|uniref:alpha/beta fold hydrolase n=1 Tax=Streptomyces sp. NPDC048718 TaxID=3365587 RepID=UPI0037206610
MDEVTTTPARTKGLVRAQDGTRIAYERYGDGPPLILVGGAPGAATAGSERALAALLARHFTVVAYDRRAGREAREIGDLAALVEAVREETGVTAAMHGTASGGTLALAAVAAGVPVGRLSVYEPYEPLPVRAAVAAEGEWVSGGDERPSGGDERSSVCGRSYGVVDAGGLDRVHARVLVIDGGASPAGTRRAARTVAAAVRRGRHRTLTGQTHEVAPHVLAPVLVDFHARELAGV